MLVQGDQRTFQVAGQATAASHVPPVRYKCCLSVQRPVRIKQLPKGNLVNPEPSPGFSHTYSSIIRNKTISFGCVEQPLPFFPVRRLGGKA